MHRRDFLHTAAVGATALAATRAAALAAEQARVPLPEMPTRYDEWLRVRHSRVITPADVDAFLQPLPNNQWAKFDAELGYVPSDSIQRDGVDGARSIYRYGAAGERKLIAHADRPCRLNTYGNSFTQCHQVSDGETWQEHLGAHLGEPIRNFGVGGYGVFQAFARLRRMERTAIKAPWVILNIYDNDHERTLLPWRGFTTAYRNASTDMFHGNPWTHLRVNLDRGRFEETPNACPTPAALRALLSFERARAVVADHEAVLLRAMIDGVVDTPQARIRRLADWAKFNFDFTDAKTRAESATALLDAVARASTLHVLEQLHAFVTQEKRRLVVLLSYSTRGARRACDGKPKLDADVALLRWLQERSIPAVDAFDAHAADFKQFRLSPADYLKRLYNGHYTPAGNQFFAFAIKPAVVEWLDPKPPAYQGHGTIIDFQDGRYLDRAPSDAAKK
jgi:hypothetical protein